MRWTSIPSNKTHRSSVLDTVVHMHVTSRQEKVDSGCKKHASAQQIEGGYINKHIPTNSGDPATAPVTAYYKLSCISSSSLEEATGSRQCDGLVHYPLADSKILVNPF